MSKNERLKQINIDKIALFLNNKYNKVFKDKNFTMNSLKYEISKLLIGKNMKLFKFDESIKKIEKSILKTLSNYGEIKYEPVQMDKINNLLTYNNNITNSIPSNTLFNNPARIPKKNTPKKFAPKLDEERKNQDCIQQPRIQSAIPKSNKLNLNLNMNNNTKKNSNEIPYPTEKMEKLREREKNKWAIQINKEYEEYLKEQDKLKKDNYEKKLKQRKFLEEQIQQRKEYQQKIKLEEKNVQPSITSLKFDDEKKTSNYMTNEKENNRRPVSSTPMIKRRNEEIEYQKKIEEDYKKYQEQEIMKKKKLKDKYKQIEKENYENALKKKKEKIFEKEKEKKEKNDVNIFVNEENKTKDIVNKNKLKNELLNKNKINQNMKHQLAINNYENQKYKREIEQEQKKLINEEMIQKEKKKKMINDFKKGLDEQIKEKQKIKEKVKETKLNENKDNLDINNKIIEENNMKNKIRYEKINNYKKDLDEQIERNKKLKQNDEF